MESKKIQENYELIKKMYLEENKSSQEIADYFGAKRHQINYILEKNGIQKSFSEARREYKLNEHYFDKIDTPNKAYILGFLYADGYNNKINNTITLSLSSEDVDILEEIRKEIDCEKPLYNYMYVNKDDEKVRHMSSLVLASKYMCETVEKWGLTQNKTFTITFPSFLDEELYSHFIRGYFDGDGCVCITKQGKKIEISIMSSRTLCEGMINFLSEKCEINFNFNRPSGKSLNNGLVRSGNRFYIKKFFDYIYKDADLYMKRKCDKFKSFFKLD